MEFPEGAPAVEGAAQHVGRVAGQLVGTARRRQCAPDEMAIKIEIPILDPVGMVEPTWAAHHPSPKRRQEVQTILDHPPKALVGRRRARGRRRWIEDRATAPTWNRLVSDSSERNIESMPLNGCMDKPPDQERTRHRGMGRTPSGTGMDCVAGIGNAMAPTTLWRSPKHTP